MGRTIETINTYGTGNATLTTLVHVADPTQTLQIRASEGRPAAHLGPVWAQMGIAADLEVFSNRMHDDVHGFQTRVQVSLSTPLSPLKGPQDMFSTDTPTVQSVFGAAPGSGVAEQAGYNVLYDDLPGSAQSLRSWAEVAPQIEHIYGQKVAPTSSATAGALGAGTLINSSYDQFKADRVYALLGYTVSAECGNVSIQGPDTANYQYGGPGAVDPLVTRDWFVRLEDLFGPPTIPILKANNKGATNVYVSHTTASTTITVGLILALLKAGA